MITNQEFLKFIGASSELKLPGLWQNQFFLLIPGLKKIDELGINYDILGKDAKGDYACIIKDLKWIIESAKSREEAIAGALDEFIKNKNRKDRLDKFKEFVKECHGDQVRKYTGEPYWHHFEGIEKASNGFGTHWIEGNEEIIWGHDLLEDTDCTQKMLEDKLVELEYPLELVHLIVNSILELTDVYTTKEYPKLNRKKRKILESERLSKISSISQSIKYLDIENNLISIKEHDPDFFGTFFREVSDNLRVMKSGNSIIRNRVIKKLYE